MAQDYFKYYNSKTLPALLIAMFLLLWLARENWQLSISLFSVLTSLLLIISTHLWKFPPFKFLFWVENFSGRYEGTIRYQFKDNEVKLRTGELKHVKLINQNGHRITIHSFTIKEDGSKSTLSVNRGIHVEKTPDDQHFQLVYHYENKGSSKQGFHPHFGTEVVKFIKKGSQKFLCGEYYTNREPFQSKGEYIELKWVSNDLNHEF